MATVCSDSQVVFTKEDIALFETRLKIEAEASGVAKATRDDIWRNAGTKLIGINTRLTEETCREIRGTALRSLPGVFQTADDTHNPF